MEQCSCHVVAFLVPGSNRKHIRDINAHHTCRDLELAAVLAKVPTGSIPAVGSLVQVTVKEHQAYGIVCALEGSDDLVGLLSPPHKPDTPLKVGESCAALVLDVYKLDGIVDLSAKSVCCPSVPVLIMFFSLRMTVIWYLAHVTRRGKLDQGLCCLCGLCMWIPCGNERCVLHQLFIFTAHA